MLFFLFQKNQLWYYFLHYPFNIRELHSLKRLTCFKFNFSLCCDINTLIIQHLRTSIILHFFVWYKSSFLSNVLMITRKMEEQFEELKCYFNAKMSEQEENMTKVFNNVLNHLWKEITKQVQNEIKSHCKHLESRNQILKHQVLVLRRFDISNQNNHKELEQYGWRLYLRIDGILTKTSQSSDGLLDSVKLLFKEAKVVIDFAHRISSRYLDTFPNKYC